MWTWEKGGFTKQLGLRYARSVDLLHELAYMAKKAMYTHKEGIREGVFCVSCACAKGRRWSNTARGVSYIGGELY
jgi:hypothetical protein